MLKPEEIDFIEEIGDINGIPVKMIRSIGGFFAASGRGPNDSKDTVLAAGSHGAIVKFELQKKFGKSFREHLNKSESTIQPIVFEKTNFLAPSLAKKGYSLYSMVTGSDVSMILSYYGDEILKQEGLVKSESLELKPQISFSNIEKSKEAEENQISKSIIMAFAETAKDLNKKNIEYATAPSVLTTDRVLNGKK